MPSTGDIAVLRFGSDAKWHWAFLPVTASSTLSFDAMSATVVGPLPMSGMSSPVKSTIDGITALGGPSQLATLSHVADEATARTAAIAVLTAGSPEQLNTFLEAYNRFLSDESAASANVAAIASEATSRAAADASEATTRAAAVTAVTPNKATATVDFGYANGNGEGDTATVTVAAAWATNSSRIVCRCSPSDSDDHTTDETIAEEIAFEAVNVVPGISFDVKAYAPQGTWGRHNCSILGI